MRILLSLLVIMLGILPSPTRSQTVSDTDRLAVRSVIAAQMEAFKQDDTVAAYGLASPTIQEKFRNPARFMTMVRRGYQQVYRPSAVDFREITPYGDQLIQLVHVVGQDGSAIVAAYIMQKQEDGSWRINGVQMREADDQMS